MTTQITRDLIHTLRQDMEDALREVEARHGISISIGNASYTHERVTFKVDAATVAADGTVRTKEVAALGCHWGLGDNPLGRQFSSNGRLFKITGANPRARKYPILATCVEDGKTYKFATAYVRTMLAVQDV